MDITNVNMTGSYGVQGSAPAAQPVDTEIEKNAAEPVEVAAPPKAYSEFGSSEKEEKGEASKNTIQEAVKKLNASTDSMEAVFGIHDDTNRVTIKMVDKSSKKVIKEFPAEQTLDMIAKVWELAGIMVDEKR